MEKIIIIFASIIITLWTIHFIKRVSKACKPKETFSTGMRK